VRINVWGFLALISLGLAAISAGPLNTAFPVTFALR
jgi:hypothetical protein